jgi:hypothetical protein
VSSQTRVAVSSPGGPFWCRSENRKRLGVQKNARHPIGQRLALEPSARLRCEIGTRSEYESLGGLPLTLEYGVGQAA